MPNKWVSHVQEYAKKHKVSYGTAMKDAGKSYKKGSASKTHKGDKDFTTKKGNKDHHVGGHDIKTGSAPYTT